MPYARRYRRRYRRRRRPRSSGFVKKATSYATMAYSAYKGVKAIKRLINVEKKKSDVNVLGQAVSTTVYGKDLVLIAEGSGSEDRDGTSIKPLSLLLRYNITYNTAGADYQKCRVVLLKDTQQQSDTAVTYSNVVESITNLQSPLNKNSVGRYTILHDSLHILSALHPVAQKERILKLSGHIKYNGAASTDIQKNGLYLFAIGDQATNTPSLDYYTRLTFTDN